PFASGVFFWTAAWCLPGLARSYPQLLAGRAVVGIGEAACVAIAPALLADFFAADRRGRVLSVLNMAIPVGSALGYIVGGQVGHHFGWAAAVFVAGIPGLLLALAGGVLGGRYTGAAPRAGGRAAAGPAAGRSGQPRGRARQRHAGRAIAGGDRGLPESPAPWPLHADRAGLRRLYLRTRRPGVL